MGENDNDIDDHLDWCRNLRGYTAATIRHRTWTLYRLRATIDRPLRDAEVGHIQFWEQTVVAGLAPQSRRAYIGHVKAFFRWAVQRGIVIDDPTVMLTRPKVPKPLPRPIGEGDLTCAIAAASPKLAAMIVLTAYAGLRAMEVSGLQWSDLRDTDAGWHLFIRGKGRRERLVPIGSVVIAALRAHGWGRRGPVFVGRDGRQITPNGVAQVINDHYARLGIAATSHHGRHRYVSVGVEELGDVVLMQHLAGHESLTTTQIYAAYSPEKAARLVAALDARAQRKRPARGT